MIAFLRERADALGIWQRIRGHDSRLNRGTSAYKLTDLDTTERDRDAGSRATAAADAPVVHLDGVTVVFGDNRALQRGQRPVRPRGRRPARPERRGQEHDAQGAARLHQADHGRMTVLGLDVAHRPMDIRARIGYMPESDAHIPGMNAVSFVAYCGQLAGLPAVDAMQRAHEVLYYVGLGEARYRNIETYSTGMKQRIKLAQALVHDPDLLFLDEPTNGMDPKGRDEMLELIRDLGHKKNVNLILSSHLLPDVEYTCDDVIVMDKGQVVAQGPIAELKGPGGRVFELRIKGDLPGVPRRPARSRHGVHVDRRSDVMRVFVPGDRARARAGRRQRSAKRCSRSRPSTACRSGTCGRAFRRSRTCSPRRWGKSKLTCRFTIRATGDTAAERRCRGRPGRSSRAPG